jgi:actin-related protein
MSGEDGTVIGKEAIAAALELKKEWLIRYPVRDSAVAHWEDYESFLHNLIYHKMRLDPSRHGFAFTESVLCSHAQRERQIQIMMDTFNAPAFCLYQAPTMAAFGDGYTQCLSVMLGGGLVQIQPVYSGTDLSAFNTRMRGVAGEHMTDYLKKGMYVEHGYKKSRQAVDSIKHELCYVASEYASTESKSAEKWDQDYTVALRELRCQAPEALFDPSIVSTSNDIPGLDVQLRDVLNRLKEDHRCELLKNVRLYGGCAKLPGIVERLQGSLQDCFGQKYPAIRVRKSSSPDTIAWVGASIVSTMASATSLWISHAEYDETGPSIVNRRTPAYL